MIFSQKYEKLFDIAEYSNIRYIIVVGGRASGKSTAVAHAIHDLSFCDSHVIVNTRFTMASTRDSVVAEMEKAIVDRGSIGVFAFSNNTLINRISGAKIIFKGLQVSSKVQTAKLKSITDFNIWVLDEAEELHDESIFDDIDDSIRRDDIRNLVIIVLNSHRINKNHFIYERFFQDRNVAWGFNGIINNTLYIHTTYLDNWSNLSESFKSKIKYLKEHYPDKYNYNFMGAIRDKAEGVIFKNWQLGEFVGNKQNIRVFGLDFGTKSPDALVQIAVRGNRLYVKEWLYKSGQSVGDLIEGFKRLKITPKDVIIADSAGYKYIKDLRQAGYYVKYSDKPAGSVISGIKQMLDYDMIVEGVNIIRELNNYVWADKRVEVPKSGDDHAIDAIRYALPFAEKLRS